jgi:hypothetical protein
MGPFRPRSVLLPQAMACKAANSPTVSHPLRDGLRLGFAPDFCIKKAQRFQYAGFEPKVLIFCMLPTAHCPQAEIANIVRGEKQSICLRAGMR